MHILHLSTLLRCDARKLARDPVLAFALALPFVLAPLLRFGLPPLEAALLELPEPVELAASRPFIGIAAILLVAMLAGWLVGFLLLEEREHRTLQALAVTPLTLRGFVLWRLALPALLALVGALVLVGVGDLACPGAATTLLLLVLAAASATSFALFLASYADNEVEGLALAKIGGLAFVLPAALTFVEGPLGWLGGVLPPYWIVRAWLEPSPVLALVGALELAAWGWWLLQRFAARID